VREIKTQHTTDLVALHLEGDQLFSLAKDRLCVGGLFLHDSQLTFSKTQFSEFKNNLIFEFTCMEVVAAAGVVFVGTNYGHVLCLKLPAMLGNPAPIELAHTLGGLAPNNQVISSLAFSFSPCTLLSAGVDGTTMWELSLSASSFASPEALRSANFASKLACVDGAREATCVSLVPGGFFIGYDNGVVARYNQQGGLVKLLPAVHKWPVRSLQWTADLKQLIVAGDSGSVVFWNFPGSSLTSGFSYSSPNRGVSLLPTATIPTANPFIDTSPKQSNNSSYVSAGANGATADSTEAATTDANYEEY
jgi:WD40 repeat protein